MPHSDPEVRRTYINEYKRRKRLERGLKMGGRKRTLTAEQREENKRINSAKQYAKNPYYTKDTAWKLWHAAKKRAKAKDLPFDLELADIVVPDVCPILGIPLVGNARRGTSRRNVASLDRVVPELGYTKGNVEVISHLANTMKSDATPEELRTFAQTILERYACHMGH